MKIVLTAAAVAAMSTVATAEVITSYALFGAPGDQAFQSANVVAANVTGMDLVRGPGLAGNVGSNSFNSAGWSTDRSQDYISFGFTVADGYEVDLSSMWAGTRSSNTGPGQLGVFYSGDGFSTAIATFSQSGTAYTNSVFDMSALTDLTGTVEFRIGLINDASAGGGSVSGTGTFRIGDHYDGANYSEFRFEGTVRAVPAPGAFALMGLGGLVAVRRRR